VYKKAFVVFFFVILSSMPVTAKEPLYRVEPPYSAHQIEQIKWAYNQGYVFGILASYGIFLELNYQKNFSLPVIRSAWENGYIDTKSMNG